MNTETARWAEADNSAIVEHILSRYHQVHRGQLAEAVTLAERVREAHGERFSAAVLPLLQEIQQDLLGHMVKEERILFPMLVNGMGAEATMPIRVMMHEHGEHEEAVECLMQLTDQLTTPEGACGTWQRLYALLAEFVADLNQHISVENEVLFARALG